MGKSCKDCLNRGKCCERFWLKYMKGRHVGRGKDRAWVLEWLRERKLPFYPRNRRYGVWCFGCLWLARDRRCEYYGKRPAVCKDVKVGSMPYCKFAARTRKG